MIKNIKKKIFYLKRRFSACSMLFNIILKFIKPDEITNKEQ